MARPTGMPTKEDFDLVEAQVRQPQEGEIVVRNEWLSVDPYMRGRMNAGRSYAPPFVLGEAMTGGAVGTVVATKASGLAPGIRVLHNLGWREHATLSSQDVRVLPTDRTPPQAYLGVLGMTGLTAYIGLSVIAPVKPGDVVFISAAAGAVGIVAGRVARALGASRVIGSAGGQAKCSSLLEIGFDSALDYKAGDLSSQLSEAAPGGIDVYFDSVGGRHLEAAIDQMNEKGGVALCGAISAYNERGPSSTVGNLQLAVGKRLTLRGYIVSDHYDRLSEYLGLAGGWLQDGSLPMKETVVDGLEHAVEALLGLLEGVNTGKMLVRLP